MAKEILIYDVIVSNDDFFGGVSPGDIIDQLDGDVHVRINSPGGDAFAGIAIYNAMRSHVGEVHVTVDALAASAASIIAMAGDKIDMADNAMMMIHNGWTFTMGDRNTHRKQADFLEKVDSNILDTYARQIGEDANKDELAAMMDEETWFTATEAMDLGLTTGITEDVKVAACLTKQQLGWFSNAPAAVAAMVQGTTTQQEPVKPVDKAARELWLQKKDEIGTVVDTFA